MSNLYYLIVFSENNHLVLVFFLYENSQRSYNGHFFSAQDDT